MKTISGRSPAVGPHCLRLGYIDEFRSIQKNKTFKLVVCSSADTAEDAPHFFGRDGEPRGDMGTAAAASKARRYRNSLVFDVSQTEDKWLPSIRGISGM
jgi:hypothetical protein